MNLNLERTLFTVVVRQHRRTSTRPTTAGAMSESPEWLCSSVAPLHPGPSPTPGTPAGSAAPRHTDRVQVRRAEPVKQTKQIISLGGRVQNKIVVFPNL
jgi:hypothetical protein